MKNLLKTAAALTLVVAFAYEAMAASYGIPLDLNGRLPGDANLVGVDVIDSTGTQNYGLGAPGYLHWIAVSSATFVEVAVLRDTDTLNATSDIKMTVVSTTFSPTSVFTFNPPVIFRNGISIKLLQASGGRWMFGYRRRFDNDISVDPSTGTSATD